MARQTEFGENLTVLTPKTNIHQYWLTSKNWQCVRCALMSQIVLCYVNLTSRLLSQLL